MLTTAQAKPVGPPLPKDPEEARRVQHQRLRRRVMYSMHEADVRDRLHEAVGPTRASAWHIVDMTSNPAWYVNSQLAALYREIPEVRPPDGGEDIAAAIADAGWWQLAQRNQRDTCAMNEMFVRVDIGEDGPAFRLAHPDLVEVVASPLAPSQPLAIREWVPDPDDTSKWVQLVTDPRVRLYQALDDQGHDVSDRVLDGDFTGERYPFLIGDRPVLPYVAYHAAETGFAMDPYTGREVFEGALQLAVYYSFFGHILRNAAWSQKWLLNAEPVGGDLDEDGRRRDVISDPAVAVVLRQIEESLGQAQVGQWAPPVDPERILGAIERYERRLVEMALSTVGVSRRESDVRSAMSLAVSREAQREAQRAYEPMFRRSDTRLLRLVSGLMGGPVDGWRIQYRSVPRDMMELESELQRMTTEIDAGLLDRVTAYQRLHPGLTRDEAERAVADIAATNQRLAPRDRVTSEDDPNASPSVDPPSGS